MMCVEIAIPGSGVVTKFSAVRLDTWRAVALAPQALYAVTAWAPGDPETLHERMTIYEVEHNPDDGAEALAYRILQGWIQIRKPGLMNPIGKPTQETHTR